MALPPPQSIKNKKKLLIDHFSCKIAQIVYTVDDNKAMWESHAAPTARLYSMLLLLRPHRACDRFGFFFFSFLHIAAGINILRHTGMLLFLNSAL